MSGLTKERIELYEHLNEQVTNTPLVRYEGEMPNGNTLWIKRLCDSKIGHSHYDKPMLDLFRHYEETGQIAPITDSKYAQTDVDAVIALRESTEGTPPGIAFDVSSGSAGISLGLSAKLLGYLAIIALPLGMDPVRQKAVEDTGAKLYFTKDPSEYVNGFIELTKEFRRRYKGKVFHLNHSLGRTSRDMNEITLNGMATAATETIAAFDKMGKHVDYYLAAAGNGCSAVSLGRVFVQNGTKVLVAEPFQSGLVYDMRYPGRYEMLYHIAPGTLPKHSLFGMSFQLHGVHVPVPTYTYAINTGMFEDVILVSDSLMDRNYAGALAGAIEKKANAAFDLLGYHASIKVDGISGSLEGLPHWDVEQYGDLGRSTQACIQACRQYAQKVHDKNFVILGYDLKKGRYEEWEYSPLMRRS